jgi:DNA-binding NarL/FixJ family response regulator
MAPASRIKLLVLHRDPIARAGLDAAFKSYCDLEVVAVRDAVREEAFETAARGEVDVVVADDELGVAFAILASRYYRGFDAKVLVIAARDHEWAIRRALTKGVRGYVLTGGTVDDLVLKVRAVHRGARCLCPRAAQRLADSLSRDALTGREEEVLRLLVIGLDNKTISSRLGIALGTVKSHLKSVFHKLQVQSRAQAIAVVERRGLLRDPVRGSFRQDDAVERELISEAS